MLRAEFDRPKEISYKGEVDIVTESDRRSEALIVARLRKHFPDHAIIAEEGSSSAAAGREILLARGPARWHHEFRARLSLLRRLDWPAGRRRADRGRGVQSGRRRAFHRGARRRRVSERKAHPRFVRRKAGPQPGGHRLSHAPAQATARTWITTGSSRCARTASGATVPPRSISARWRAAASRRSGNSA